MAPQVFDYIKQVNRLSDALLRSHGELLGRKNIRRKQDLIRVIKLDLDKLTHALLEVKENRPHPVLSAFFSAASVDAAVICERLADPFIYHVGFEIHEPLDLVLHGINHWIEHSRCQFGAVMKINDFLRFPASPSFQNRVGAYAEIMRIRIQVDERLLMLELFDIHRPADAAINGRPATTHRSFEGLFRFDDSAAGHQERVARLFASDAIWHYAFYVKRAQDVERFHAEWQALAQENSAYSMAYPAPVKNPYDHSLHTKIIHRKGADGARLELEFVTDYSLDQTVQ